MLLAQEIQEAHRTILLIADKKQIQSADVASLVHFWSNISAYALCAVSRRPLVLSSVSLFCDYALVQDVVQATEALATVCQYTNWFASNSCAQQLTQQTESHRSSYTTLVQLALRLSSTLDEVDRFFGQIVLKSNGSVKPTDPLWIALQAEQAKLQAQVTETSMFHFTTCLQG